MIGSKGKVGTCRYRIIGDVLFFVSQDRKGHLTTYSDCFKKFPNTKYFCQMIHMGKHYKFVHWLNGNFTSNYEVSREIILKIVNNYSYNVSLEKLLANN